MKISLSIVSLGLVLASMVSCNKKNTSKDHDLYIAGKSSGFPPTNFYKKNHEVVYLSNAGDDINGSIFVDGNDIYFPVFDGYLKNGVKVALPGASLINSVCVANGSVYAAGYRDFFYEATYWKDGQMVKIEPDSTYYTVSVGGIKVIGSDVYIGGTLYDSVGTSHKVMYWKNGVMNVLESGYFNCMDVSGNDVYIGGFIGDPGRYVGVYWKNGVRHDLVTAGGNKPVTITSIFAYDNDVYVTGGGGSTLYWKNGQSVGGFGNMGYPMSVVVDNSNVYVLENFVLPMASGSKSIILLWKNDRVDTLFEGSGRSMFVGTQILDE
jgi:hypothetical protein